MTNDSVLRLGTRKSPLALWQAEYVKRRLSENGVDVTLVPIATEGDQTQRALHELGGRGVFTKSLQQALLDGAIDLAVHSLKDLATEPLPSLTLVAVPERGPMSDVLIARGGEEFQQLPHGARVGTGSPRRTAQLLWARPDLTIVGLRGNVGTRIEKLHADDLDAIVLAEAGIVRLGLERQVSYRFPFDIMLPAAGQGAIGIECRADDQRTRELVGELDHPPSRACTAAERCVLRALQAGCLTPLGVAAVLSEEGQIEIEAAILDPEGTQRIAARGSGPMSDAEFIGRALAMELIDEGAGDLVSSS